ncbi:hypothetical protein [Streptomyces blastmyceticus]|uniref:Uncharacterized protein n=1 Tax=Streptomyces blastmyceticus TaxID=68180 RepID=A0ABN0WQY5_9ACTN
MPPPRAAAGRWMNAPYKAGRSFTDSAAGVRIDVLRSGAYGDTVRVTKS